MKSQFSVDERHDGSEYKVILVFQMALAFGKIRLLSDALSRASHVPEYLSVNDIEVPLLSFERVIKGYNED